MSLATSISMNARQPTIHSVLCGRFQVKRIVQDKYISKAYKAEMFLLGASFSKEIIAGDVWNIAINGDTLYLLDREE